ncbi:LEA14-like dessication related protein [Formivibrio citricus]|uniref:LEA14-like dessication related protein n=1 Tax=Formivibrio citricus TaxID=83765 RepID=A0A1I5BJE6_9NEIS|nr:LEA type 2 family protein [Formivibrio citricus]SFN74865.1 LEA14-like dessication related protein [Formivibrio citricus]
MRRLFLIMASLLLSACAGVGSIVEKPSVSLAGIEIEGLGLFEQRFLVSLRITNPNDVSVTMDGVDFNLDLNGEHFASGMSRETVTLPRLGETEVKLKVTTRLDMLWKQLKSLQNGERPLGYHLTGRLYAPWIPGGMPFERKDELPALKRFIPKQKENNGQSERI